MSYCYDFKKNVTLDVKTFHLIFTNSSFAAANFISVEVFLQHHAAPRLQMVSAQLIDAHQVQKVKRQQSWLAGRCKTLTPCVTVAMQKHIVCALA
jgi:hypothetical protein